ncbi:MAG TPA: dUTP diphosphatase [Patescibacteria group bacterium]|nr:dUTP diphosphatase [Patescibacteria group bacterium]
MSDSNLVLPVVFKRLRSDVPIPEYKTTGAVAFDIAVPEGGIIQPGETKFFKTGLVIQLPIGYILLIAPRSSNAKKHIRLANGIGVFDWDFCGPEDEITLAFHNFGSEPYELKDGERIAQGFFTPVAIASFVETDTITAPNRGNFGTTG